MPYLQWGALGFIPILCSPWHSPLSPAPSPGFAFPVYTPSTSSPSAYKDQQKEGCAGSSAAFREKVTVLGLLQVQKNLLPQDLFSTPLQLQWLGEVSKLCILISRPNNSGPFPSFLPLHPEPSDSAQHIPHIPVHLREGDSTERLLRMQEAPASPCEAWESFIQPRYSSAPRRGAESGQATDVQEAKCQMPPHVLHFHPAQQVP